MPMLRGCDFPGCATLTLSAYCLEHELLIRAGAEVERPRPRDGADAEIVGVREATA